MEDIARSISDIPDQYQRLENRIHELQRQSLEYASLLERSPDPIVIYDQNGKAQYINPGFTAVFGFTRDDVIGKSIPFVPEDEKEKTAWAINELINGRQLSGFETKRLTKDGREIDISMSTYHYYNPEGGFAGTIVISRDVTEQKKMEMEIREKNQALEAALNELKLAQVKLIDKAHKTGMSEIASSVLHNIGNAINSVGIRICKMREAVEPITIDYLNGIYDLIETVRPQINLAFSAEDPQKGDKILRFLKSIISGLSQDLDTLSHHMDFLDKSISHIAEIIAVHQKYAGVSSIFVTSIDPNLPIHDALELLDDSIKKRKINVILNLQPVGPILTDKNKLMQVLINLIKNAYEAIDENFSGTEKQIEIASEIIVCEGTGYVEIRVTDTGIGISPEDLKRVFQVNFSTKRSGSGFGLHGSANFIRSQDGEIELTSCGIGKGATAILRLPITKECSHEQKDSCNR
ncbi:MAG: PAS domain S-box protein [Deltaproteobacteria bacterium]|nr:PAS domain S-box protein [Deltaproteobacteria bacterium]